LTLSNMSASALGLTGLDISAGDASVATAITALDAAIGTVSTNRGTIGAMQNRFESMISNLQVTTENLAASESRIRDTDMAAEMVEFTKNQVLSQAGTAMLAQANQIPQGILSLIRG
jgi:flagellin